MLKNNYKIYAVIIKQNDLFTNEVFEEVLRERANYYKDKNITNNFWITLLPSKLYFNENIKKIENSYAAIISTDLDFINWIQLRFGYFIKLENLRDLNKLEIIYSYTVNGGLLEFLSNDKETTNILLNNNLSNLDSSILANQYIQLINWKNLLKSKNKV